MPGKRRNPAKKGSAPASPAWDLQDIQQLLDLLIKREITEFEFKKGGVKLRIRRGNLGFESPVAMPLPEISFAAPSPSTSTPKVNTVPAVAAATVEPPAPESTEGLFIIKSPMVGTFYASPSPNAPPFVKVGDPVQVGQVLCIIEAMKLMNEIEAETAGEVARIYVDNGQPVEYGESLFAIRPSHKK